MTTAQQIFHSTFNEPFLKELNPYLCGSKNGVSETIDVCVSPPKELDFSEYNSTRFKSYIPFVVPTHVKYCQQFNKFIATNPTCTEISPELQKELLGTAGEAADAAVPSEIKIYNQLVGDTKPWPTKGSPTDSAMRKKAKELRAALLEIRELKKKNDTAGAEEKIEEFKTKIRASCLVENPADMATATQICKDTVQDYDDKKAALQSALKWGGGSLLAGVTTLFALIKTGVIPKMIQSAKDERVASKANGDKWFMRTLKVIGAFFSAGTITTPAVTEEPPVDSTAPATDAPADTQPATPVETAPAASDDADKTPIPQIDNSDPRQRTKAASDAIGLLLHLAPRLNAGSGRTNHLVAAVARADASKLKHLVTALMSEGTAELVHSFLKHFEEIVYDDLIPEAQVVITMAREAFGAARPQMDRLRTSLKEALKLKDQVGRSYSQLQDIAAKSDLASDHPLNKRLTQMKHTLDDVDEILGVLKDGIAPEQFRDKSIPIALDKFNIADINSLIDSAIWPSGHEALRNRVEIIHEDLNSTIPVPERYRRDLSKIVHEAVSNGIKFNDAKKSRRAVMINPRVKGNMLTIVIEDNGVGGLTDEVTRNALEQPTQHGLETIFSVCRKNGWEVNFSTSSEGGVKATFTIDISTWKNGAPPKTDRGVTPEATRAATPADTAAKAGDNIVAFVGSNGTGPEEKAPSHRRHRGDPLGLNPSWNSAAVLEGVRQMLGVQVGVPAGAR